MIIKHITKHKKTRIMQLTNNFLPFNIIAILNMLLIDPFLNLKNLQCNVKEYSCQVLLQIYTTY